MEVAFGVLNYGAHYDQLRRKGVASMRKFSLCIHEDLLGSKQEQGCDSHPLPVNTPLSDALTLFPSFGFFTYCSTKPA
jgi:hypothetical protein